MGSMRTRGRRDEDLGSDGRPISQLGATIRAWRKYRGLSGTELAVRAGLGETGRSYISQIEHGYIQQVGEQHLLRLASVLDVPADDILAWKSPPPAPPPAASAPRFSPAISRRALVADSSLREFTDPNQEFGVVLRWSRTLSEQHVPVFAVRDVPANATQMDVDGLRYTVTLLTDSELPVPPSVWSRIEALTTLGVPFSWWLLAEHQLPGVSHEFSRRSVLIGVIATAQGRGAWCIIGKWAQ